MACSCRAVFAGAVWMVAVAMPADAETVDQEEIPIHSHVVSGAGATVRTPIVDSRRDQRVGSATIGPITVIEGWRTAATIMDAHLCVRIVCRWTVYFIRWTELPRTNGFAW